MHSDWAYHLIYDRFTLYSMCHYWNRQQNQKSQAEFQHPHPQSKFILKMNTKLQKFSTVVFKGSDLNTLSSGRDMKAQRKVHCGSRANMLQMQHAKLQSSTRCTPQSWVPHNFIYIVFLVLNFRSFFSDTILIKTKLILLFFHHQKENISKKHLFYFFSFCNSQVTSSCHSLTSTACNPKSSILFCRSKKRLFPFEMRPYNSEIIWEHFGRGTWGSSSSCFSKAHWLGALGAGAKTDTWVRGGCGTSFDDQIMETTY